MKIMWRTCEDRAYPFKHHHTNFFPPPPKSSDSSDCEDVPIVFFGENQEMESIVRTRNYPLTTPKTPPPFILFDPSGGINPQLLFVPVDEEDMSPKTTTPAPSRPRIPMIRSATEKNFQPPSPPPTFNLPLLQKPKIIPRPVATKSSQRPTTPPNSTKKPSLLRIQTGPTPPTTASKNPPPTPSALAPLHLTGLLQEVLSIMNTIMSQQTIVQEEEDVLRDLTELVVIMQDEAEALVNMADLVEEYVDEITIAEQAAEIQEWVSDLELDSLLGTISSPTTKNHQGRGNDRKKGHVRQPNTRIRHEREDSGIGLDSESEIDPQRNFQIVVPYQHQNNHDNGTPTKPILSPNIFTPPHRIQQQQASSPRSSQKKAPSYARPTVASQKHPSKTKSKQSPQPFRDSGLDILSPVGVSPISSGRSSRSTRRPYGRWM